jgi:transcription-repair coupling factor (superfamily II helicase)
MALFMEAAMNRSVESSMGDESELAVSQWSGAGAREVLESVGRHDGTVVLRRVERSALGYLIALGLKSLRAPWLVIAPTDREAESLLETVAFFWGRDNPRPDQEINRRLRFLPSRAGHKVQSLGKTETTARRMESLFALRSAPEPICVVTSAVAMMERVMPADLLVGHTGYLVKGDEIDLDHWTRRLTERGYYRAPLVEEYGDFSRRGGVLDIYAPLYRWPLRLELFGNELDSIRMFHPGTQRSMGNLEEAVLLPTSEVILDDASRERAEDAVRNDVRAELITPAAAHVWLERIREGQELGGFEAVMSAFHEKMWTLTEYLPPETIVLWTDKGKARREMEETTWRLTREWEAGRSMHEWARPPSELLEDPGKVESAAASFRQLVVGSLTDEAQGSMCLDLATSGQAALALAIRSHSHKERLLEPLAAQCDQWQRQGIRTFLVCSGKEQARRLSELMQGYGVDTVVSDLPFGEESFDAPVLKILVGQIEEGFLWPAERLAVLWEEEILGRRGRRRQRKSVSGLFLSSFNDLHVGDFVVHVDHGIGVYRELAHLTIGGVESDFLRLEYQGNDRLYVPVDKLQRVQKYLGVEGENPRLDRLGGKSWEAAKKKAKESAERIAQELLDLYAKRQMSRGFQFSPPGQLFMEFETTFSYDETPDQAGAIEDVLEDMASERPMDRLVCGDVGYGKTEVALRAAFKAVLDGKQVAMLVPTTVLAEQHYHTFSERFEGFPIEVASLSRFRTPSQQKQILERLGKGTLDVIIGTHRLLQKDVRFHDLGLLIVDEEHRFGVKHKERLKQFRVAVDVLTLTATPIPRTLQMSMAGIRDLSTIETAPQDRRAIETLVTRYDELTVREAIYRELQRGGQVFFVHNHVQSIYQMATTLGRLVPEARVAVAHGQMKERDLEKIMLDFIHRQVDVLVCTTIIESGLDIPAANTIIINRADRFGLAQIYQLRGRVGRSNEQAYAYLLIPGEDLITRDAQKRLRALMDFSELGVGFKIALNDLQIRGGGTILGSAQSGHIAAVGYELYLDLLDSTIREYKGEEPEPESPDPEISIPIAAFLPEDFIPDTDQRLLAYKRLATLSDEAAIDDLAVEWRDRYGPFPDSTRNLILLAKVRLLFKNLAVVRLDGDAETFVLHFSPRVDLMGILSGMEESRCAYTLETDRRLRVEVWGRTMAQRLSRLKRVLQGHGENVSDEKA